MLPKQSGEARQGLHCTRGPQLYALLGVSLVQRGTSFVICSKEKVWASGLLRTFTEPRPEMKMEGYTLNADYSKVVKSG